MKRLLLFGCSFFAAFSFSQTTIYSENFESGNTFTMNTSDLGASTTYNTWLMNNTYSGGSGTVVCLGFPFSFTVVNTPTQPVGISGAPTSHYMHITAQAAASSGINCASFIPSDGTCVTDETNFAKMTLPISTVGFTNVTFDFWWMCAGSSNAFGQLYYSTDNGATWVLKQTNLNNVSNWSQTALSDGNWDNQAFLQFAFRFVNTTSTTAADPAFCVDEITVTGESVTNEIVIDNIQPQLSWCEGTPAVLQVVISATGTYNVGNVFTAQLSDASGSFAAPTTIGTLASSNSATQMMPCNVPGTIPAGTGYRIRIVASDPVTIGADNGIDIVIYPSPTVTSTSYSDICLNEVSFLLNGGSPSGGVYSGNGVSNGEFDPIAAGVGLSTVTYLFTDANGCSNSVDETINVLNAPTAQLNLPLTDLCIYAAPVTLTGGSPSGGTYSGTGVTGGVFDPAVAGIGAWPITYTITDPALGCSDSTSAVLQVTACASVNENVEVQYAIYPNPTEGNFTLISEISFGEINLLDLNGRVLLSFEANELVDVSELSAGVYLIEMKWKDQRLAERIVIN